MNFLKSVFSDEPDPPTPEPEPEPKPNPPDSNPPQTGGGDGGTWNFGGLIKTLTTKSGSVIETYRRDLKEFGSGLRKEIEVAQGSFGSVGHTIDEIGSSVLKGTAQIISQGKDAILAVENPEIDYNSSDNSYSNGNYDRGMSGLSSKRYSRFDAVVRGVQGDPNTYIEEPEDKEEYEKWKMGFGLGEKREEMEKLVEDNGEMRSVYGRLVPGVVEEEEFWFRYYYKVLKVRQAEDVRADIVRRAISRDEEEELSWDVEDEKGEERVEEVKGEEGNVELGSVESGSVMSRREEEEGGAKNEGNVDVKVVKEEEDEENSVEGSKFEKVSGEEVKDVEKSEGGDVMESNEKVASDGSESSDALMHPPLQEEDLEWDEIEDLSSIDEKNVGRSASPNKVDLHKRLSAAEEEDLSWDTEDDDDVPAKA